MQRIADRNKIQGIDFTNQGCYPRYRSLLIAAIDEYCIARVYSS